MTLDSKIDSAVILAAGRSKATAPYSYEMPKALYKVHGQPLIERLIFQLREAGIDKITIVIGHMKEKFLYLREKFDVNFIINKDFDNKGNIWSLYLAKEKVGNSVICDCDCYYPVNPFIGLTTKELFHTAKKQKISTNKLCVCNDNHELNQVKRGGGQTCLTGFAVFNQLFAHNLFDLLSKEINSFSVNQMYWEEYIGCHSDILKMSWRLYSETQLIEFNSLDDLQNFDDHFLDSIDSNIFVNISKILNCQIADIHNICAINGGLTNVSFKFSVGDQTYVYRHPGVSSSNFINRQSEEFTQKIAYQLGIDKTFIAMDVNEGWKISHFMENCKPLDYSNKQDLKSVMEMLRRLHQCKVSSHYELNTFLEAERLLKIASHKSSALLLDFKPLKNKIEKLYHLTELDCFPKSLCHNDTYNVNFLVNEKEINIIDWEYSGYGDPANDIGSIICRHPFTDEEIDEILLFYFGRKLTAEEYRHYMAYIAISGWYWFCWSLCKDSLGDDFGFYFLESYDTAQRFSNKALKLYGLI